MHVCGALWTTSPSRSDRRQPQRLSGADSELPACPWGGQSIGPKDPIFPLGTQAEEMPFLPSMSPIPAASLGPGGLTSGKEGPLPARPLSRHRTHC